MDEKGITRADLARECKVTPAAITILFRKGTKQSRLVPQIHKALGMVNNTEPAAAIERDDAFRRLQRVWKELTDAQREHLVRTGEFLVDKR